MTAKQQQVAELAMAEIARRKQQRAAKRDALANGTRFTRVTHRDIGVPDEWLRLGKVELAQIAATGKGVGA